MKVHVLYKSIFHLSLAEVGKKLQTLFPRMVLQSLSSRDHRKAAIELRQRCKRYLDGDWGT